MTDRVAPSGRADAGTRLAEIRQENVGGGVSASDIEWLLNVADAARWLAGSHFGQLRERDFYRLREAINGR